MAAQRVQNIAALRAIVADGSDARLPDNARLALGGLARQLLGRGAGVWRGDRRSRPADQALARRQCRKPRDGGDHRHKAWAQALLARKLFKAAAVALASKSARIVWAILTRGGVCRGAIGQNGAPQTAPAAA